jgi:membrane protease YdiL (CAAX protease family)
MPDLEIYWQLLRDWLYLALALAVPMACLGWLVRKQGRGLLPPLRRRAVPWSGIEVLACFVIVQIIGWFAVDLYRKGPFLTWLYGAGNWPEVIANIRRELWAATTAFPFQLVVILLLLQSASDTRPYQLGWTAHRSHANVLLAFLCWLAVMPAILLFHRTVTLLYEHFGTVGPERHVLEQLIRAAPAPADWVLLVLSALVAAPVIEECLYRGVLQNWAGRQQTNSDIVVAFSFGMALLCRQAGLEKALQERSWAMLVAELHPVLCVAALLPVYLAVRKMQRSPEAGAVFASSLLFAIWHARIWPSPIPLFLLGLVLGDLACRTRSLVAPIVLHSLFNAVAVLGLMHHDPEPVPVPNGNSVTSTGCRPPSASASSWVPGVSLPRRM